MAHLGNVLLADLFPVGHHGGLLLPRLGSVRDYILRRCTTWDLQQTLRLS